jgi:hypothetical protein
VQADGVTAGKPDILKWEIQVNRRLFYGSVGKKDLAFDEPIPATAKKTQEKYPQQQSPDSQDPDYNLLNGHIAPAYLLGISTFIISHFTSVIFQFDKWFNEYQSGSLVIDC